jgi:deazaflavin-dependent oxidoreductase (nitroreductase family)
MANWAWFTKFHKKVFALTGGRVGARMGGQDIVMIDTIGRKSGQLRRVPVACYSYKDVTVVGSNNGLDKHPVWWLNLQSKPCVDIQLGTESFQVEAVLLAADEREEAWQEIIRINPRQKNYQAALSARQMPIIYLKPVD